MSYVNPLLLAADNHDFVLQRGAPRQGFWEGAGEAVFKGAPSVIASAVAQTLNIPTNIGAAIGLTDKADAFSIRDILGGLDDALGTDLDAYYSAHAEAVDTLGYVGASLVPGTVGVKVLRGVQAGTAGRNIIGSTVLNPPAIAESAVRAAKLDILNKGSTFNYLNGNAVKAIAAGAGQGVLEAAAFETMAAAALYSSPHFEDKSFTDIAGDIIKDSLVWGGLFGSLGATTAKGDGLFGFRKEVLSYEKTTVDAVRGVAAGLADKKLVAGMEENIAAGTIISYLHRDATSLATKDPKVLDELITPFLTKGDPSLAAGERAMAEKVFAQASKDLRLGIKNLIDTKLLDRELLAEAPAMRQAILDGMFNTIMNSDGEKISNLLVGAKKISPITAENTVDMTMPEVFRAQIRGAGNVYYPTEEAAIKKYIDAAEAARAKLTNKDISEEFLSTAIGDASNELLGKNVNVTANRLTKAAGAKLKANGLLTPEVDAALKAQAELTLARASVTRYKLPYGKVQELDINDMSAIEAGIAAGVQVAKGADGSYALIGRRNLPMAERVKLNGRVVNLKTGEALDFAQNLTAHDLPVREALGFKLTDLGGFANGLLNKFRNLGLAASTLADDSAEAAHDISLLWADASRLSYKDLLAKGIKDLRQDLPYAEELFKKMPDDTTFMLNGEPLTKGDLGFAIKDAKIAMIAELSGKLPNEVIAHRLNASLEFVDNPTILMEGPEWHNVVEHDSLTHAFTSFDRIEANKFTVDGMTRAAQELSAANAMKRMDLASIHGDLAAPPAAKFGDDKIMLAGGEGTSGLLRAAASTARNEMARWAMAATRYGEKLSRKLHDEITQMRQPVVNAIQADRVAQAELASIEFWKQGNRQFGNDADKVAELGRTKVIAAGETMFLVRESYLQYLDDQVAIMQGAKSAGMGPTPRFTIENGRPVRGNKTMELTDEDRLLWLQGEANARTLAPDSGVLQVKTPAVRKFYETQLKVDRLNLERATKLNKWNGTSSPIKQMADNIEGWLYNPPPDYSKMPFVFIARHADGAEASMLSRGERAVVRAKDKEDLIQKRAAAEAAGYVTYTSKDGDKYFKELGIYDYSESLTNSSIRSDLANKGILTHTLEAEKPEEILNRYAAWDLRKSRQSSIAFLKAEYGQVFAKILGSQVDRTDEGTSVVKAALRKTQELIGGEPLGYTNADRLVDTVLGMPQKGVGRGLVQLADAGINKLAKTLEDMFTRNPEVPADLDMALGKLRVNDAVHYAVKEAFARRPDATGAWAAKAIGGINTLISTLMLRLDPLHHITNVFSTPVLQVPLLKQMLGELEKQGKFTDELKQLLTVDNMTLGSYLSQNKLYYESLMHNAGPRESKLAISSPTLRGVAKENETFAELYVRLGLLNKDNELYRQELLDTGLDMVNAIGSGAMDKASVMSKVQELWGKTSGARSKVLGVADMLESHTHFASIDAIRVIADKAGMDFNEARIWMNWFVQQNHGLMTASQKGQLFSGVSGSAIGLFQSYQFRLMQRAMEFHEVGDRKALLMMGALQGTIFGATSLPMFDTINRHIVSDGDRRHRDIFSNTYELVQKDVGDMLLHGAGSSLLRVDMSSRANTTPRHLTLVPTSLEDIPAVSVLMQTGEFLGKIGSAAANGADMSQATLEAISHNPWNRPVRGIAELVLGYTTTKRGHVNAIIGQGLYEDAIFEHSQYLRLLGGKPLAEQVALNTAYRMEMYRQADKEKRDKLAKAYRSHVLEEGQPDDAGFLEAYVKSGGNIEGYNQWATQQYRHATIDRIGRLHTQIKNDPMSQQMLIQLGGSPTGQ